MLFYTFPASYCKTYRTGDGCTPDDKNDSGTFDKFRVFLLALGHFTVDVYADMLPPLLTIFNTLYGISYTMMGILTAVFSITSTLVQPVFGYVADRYGKKWIAALGVAWIAVGMCVLSIAQTPGVMLVIVGLAGIGSAMYHPQASAMVSKASGSRKGLGMSIFMAGGNIGYAIMTLLTVIIVAMFGLSSLLYLIPGGIVVGLLIYVYAPTMDVDRKSPVDLKTLFASFKSVKGPLAVLLGVVSLRAWVCMGMITFIGTFYYSGHFIGWTFLGYDIAVIGWSITLFLFVMSNAVGGIIGGWAAERFGNKAIIAPTLIASAPFFYLAFVSPDIFVWPLIAIAGGLMYASISPTTIMAQELLPRSQAMAGGLVLGFANGVGGLLVFLNGMISDYFHDPFAGLLVLIGIIVLSGLLAILLPGKPEKVPAPVPVTGH
ncbi:MAG: MFS transporter [Methanocella sp.]